MKAWNSQKARLAGLSPARLASCLSQGERAARGFAVLTVGGILMPHEHEIRIWVAVFCDEAEFRLHVGEGPVFEELGNNQAKQRATNTVVIHSGRFRARNGCCKMKLGDLGCGHP